MNTCTINSVGSCVRADNTSGKPSHDTSHTLGVTSHRCSPFESQDAEPFFPPVGHHFSPFHPPQSGNEDDVPSARGQNSLPWPVKGERGELIASMVCDDREVRASLGSQQSTASFTCSLPQVVSIEAQHRVCVCIHVWIS